MYTIFTYKRAGAPERYAVYSTSADHIVAHGLTEEQLLEWHIAQAADEAARRVKRLLRIGGYETMRPTEITKYAQKAAESGRPPWDPNAPKSLQQRVAEALEAKREAHRDLDAADIKIEAIKAEVLQHHKKVEAKAREAGQAVPLYDRLVVDITEHVATVGLELETTVLAGSYYTLHCDEHGEPFEYTYPLADL